MSWDALAFLQAHNVAYRERGPNVAKGHVAIRCPFCGNDDPSEHMGIRISDGAWGCFRNPDHRGRSPLRIVSQLLGCDKKVAADIVRPYWTGAPLEQEYEKPTTPRYISWPREMRPFTSASHLKLRFLGYLRQRGFPESLKVAANYKLRWAVTGKWAHRIVFPLFDLDGKLCGWTGRAIADSYARYKAHPTDGTVKSLLWNTDQAKEGGGALILCEGPIDAMKLDWYGRWMNVRAVAMLGMSCGQIRRETLMELMERFERLWICLDARTTLEAHRLAKDLTLLGARVVHLPDGVPDPGSLAPTAARAFLKGLLGEDAQCGL